MTRAEHFLAIIAGREPASGLIEVRYFVPDRPTPLQRFFGVLELADAAAFAITAGRRHDTYVGTAPRIEMIRNGRQFGGNAAVERAWMISADCDTDPALDALDAFTPEPTMVIASGGVTDTGRPKLHAHFALVESVGAADLVNGKKRLAAALGSDPAICDEARVMRVPGTFNYKGDEPRPVTAYSVDLERLYTLRQVVGRLPDPEPPRSRPRRRATHRTENATPALGPRTVVQAHDKIRPVDYVRDFTGVEIDARGFCRCPLPDHEDRTPSFECYKTAEDGWFCHGCRRGGRIMDFAGILIVGKWGRDLRGADARRVWRAIRAAYDLPLEEAA